MKHARPINTNGQAARVTQSFSAGHPGTDYGYPTGTPVYASQDGQITVAIGTETRQWIANQKTGSLKDPYAPTTGTRALRNEDYGNRLQIDHGSNHRTLYAHLQYNSLLVKVGDKVKKGQMIARVGSTGNSSGDHLHYELMVNGAKVNLADHIDSAFTNYTQAPAQAQDISIGKDLFEKLVRNSTLADEVVRYLSLGDSADNISFDNIKNSLEARDGKLTSCKNELSTRESDLAKALQEISNREEQVSRLKSDLLNQAKLHKAEIDALKSSLKEPEEILIKYQSSIEQLQSDLKEEAKAKGKALNELAEARSQLESAQKGQFSEITLSIWLQLFWNIKWN